MPVRRILHALLLSMAIIANSFAANPFITSIYTADPSAHVWSDGRLYVYPSRDIDPPQGSDLMDRYHVFSTENMVNWRDEGEILNASQVAWGRAEGGFMWAPDCAYKDGVYYFYFPHPSGTDWNNTWKVGVATSLEPASGFTPLTNYMAGVGAFSMIDPAVFMDDDGQAYFYYGGGGTCQGAKLKPNMVELATSLTNMTGLNNFHEATWVFKRNGIYYLTYADGFNGSNRLQYATSTNALGPWTSKGVYLDPTGCDTSHGSLVQYKGQWYQFYHNKAVSGQNNLRSICVDVVNFDTNGNILKIVQTTNGPPLNGPVIDPIVLTKYEAENAVIGNGVVVANDGAASGGKCLQNFHLTNSFVQFNALPGGANGGLASLSIHFAAAQQGKLRLTVNGVDDSFINTLNTTGWSTFTGETHETVPLQPGSTNVIRLTGGYGGVNVDYITLDPIPAAPWNALVAKDASFGVQSNRFGFNVVGDNLPVEVDGASDLTAPAWLPIVTNVTVGGSFYFSDPQPAGESNRFYRLKQP